jgi:SH3 domain-containing YSC84-like protein 1
MATPDRGSPAGWIERASCVVIVPGLKKAALAVGGQYGKGFVTCRKTGGTGWSEPADRRLGNRHAAPGQQPTRPDH